jgi:hypothetical protein
MKTIFELELHEVLNVDPNTFIMKVATGWIYTTTLKNRPDILSQVFVPNAELEYSTQYKHRG